MKIYATRSGGCLSDVFLRLFDSFGDALRFETEALRWQHVDRCGDPGEYLRSLIGLRVRTERQRARLPIEFQGDFECGEGRA